MVANWEEIYFLCLEHFPGQVDRESFVDLPIVYVKGMLEHIKRKWRYEAMRLGDQTAHLAYYVMASQGHVVKDYDSLNIFRRAYEAEAQKGSQAAAGADRVRHISPRAAEGLVQAVERGLLPDHVWLQIAPVWHNIAEKAGSYTKQRRTNGDNRRSGTQRPTRRLRG